MKFIIPILFIFVNSQSYLIVEETKKEYKVFKTMYGFYPYGRIIEGYMHFVNDLCTNSHSGKQIIVTSFSNECNAKVQLYNSKEALAVIYAKENLDEEQFLDDFYSETATMVSMQKIDIFNLKKAFDSKIQLTFPILIQTEKPFLYYVVYELIQQIEVLKLLKEFELKGFKFDLQIIYFTTHSQLVEQDCLLTNLVTLPIFESSVQYKGLKINCRSQFETKYLIKTNRDSQLSRTQILQEEIRQICTLQIYGIELWRQYRSQFTNRCLLQQKFIAIYNCSMDIRHNLLMDEDQVQTCYTNSFYNNNQSNKLLDEQLRLSEGIGKSLHKERVTIIINKQLIYGNYSFDTNTLFDSNKSSLFLAMCESYQVNNRPQICYPNSIITQPSCNWYCELKIQFSSDSLIFIIIVLFVGLIVGLYYLIKKYQLRGFEQNQINKPKSGEDNETQEIKEIQEQS